MKRSAFLRSTAISVPLRLMKGVLSTKKRYEWEKKEQSSIMFYIRHRRSIFTATNKTALVIRLNKPYPFRERISIFLKNKILTSA